MKLIIIVSSITLLLDQIIKILISTIFEVNSGFVVIPKFFDILYVRNYGAAFNILDGNVFLLIGISLLSLFLLYYFFIRNKEIKKLESIIYGLLIGGIIGNLIDRVFLGYVVDYLAFNIFGYNFPVFNLADTCIVISTFLLIFILGSDKNENKSSKSDEIR